MRNTINITDVHLSDNEKSNFRNSILSLSGALVCLAAALIYGKISPQQDIIKALIYLAGICIIGLPMLITAVQGLISKNTKYAMEILVSIAMIYRLKRTISARYTYSRHSYLCSFSGRKKHYGRT